MRLYDECHDLQGLRPAGRFKQRSSDDGHRVSQTDATNGRSNVGYAGGLASPFSGMVIA